MSMTQQHENEELVQEQEVPEQTDSVDVVDEVAEFRDRYQRTLAELDNQRKRFDEEAKKARQFSMASAALDLLPAIDNLQRAAKHVPEALTTDPWVQGVLHIERQLTEVLQRWGASPIAAAVGDAFDSSRHEAISTTPVRDDLAEDCIAQVVATGYIMHERVLRPVQVIVTSSN
jgi:molecular chaperone GrpE